ncbi:hypothetical protein [Francisella sp. SYW-9]|uniref:hypothetical protein n=1 Tax=Francisella sp. SYW-9 TaxID=2610888 RepID=UPI00123D8AEB|nr:hypothetical protein [Francisella sp. SYW-9]
MRDKKDIFAIANGFLGRDDIFNHLINGKLIEISPNDYEPKFSVDIDYNKSKKYICIHLNITNQNNYLDAFFCNQDINYNTYPNLSRALERLIEEEFFH